MAETRVDKYKDYRDSFTKHDTKTSVGVQKTKRSSNDYHTTNTLSLEDVMGKVDESNRVETNNEWKKKKIIQISIIVGISLVVLAILIVLGIKAFGGK